jgi:cytoskeleton protein RodZ
MNSERAEQPHVPGQPGTVGAGGAPGLQLAGAREALGLTVAQVADQLKLAPRQVVALEAGDMASLPNLAVVRGFVRAYAKVVKLDAAPLVAMIANPLASNDMAAQRRQVPTSFSEARFPIMGKRHARPTGKIVAGLLLVLAVAGAYRTGWIPSGWLTHAVKDGAASATARLGAGAALDKLAAPAGGQLETTLIQPGQDLAPVPSTSVPLISVPPAGAAGSAPAAPGLAPGSAPAGATLGAGVGGAAAATAPVANNALVLTVAKDTRIEIRRSGAPPLIARVVKAGSTETFDITQPVVLIVSRPAGVSATLRGVPLELTRAPGRTASRLNLK